MEEKEKKNAENFCWAGCTGVANAPSKEGNGVMKLVSPTFFPRLFSGNIRFVAAE